MNRKRKIIPVLEELAKKMEVLSVAEQRRLIGGGNGTYGDPYTWAEVDGMDYFNGGYVVDPNGAITYWAAESVCYGLPLTNPGPGSTYVESYGAYGGGLVPHYYDSTAGSALDAIFNTAVNSLGLGSYGEWLEYTKDVAVDTIKAKFNAQLGSIMANNNYPSGQPFYLQDAVSDGTVVDVYSYDGRVLGRISIFGTYSY
ncbi:MAG: hypothetical protein LBR13_01345 [Dysgonamonadaceae bacterium]|jgi:hypothetical protein|nr:hypothetical protein [Dysgonamonadaceae bacterium]